MNSELTTTDKERSSTPRTPHSPGQPAGSKASMASPRAAASAASAIRPVTARTWQALNCEQSASSPGSGPRQVSVYTNDLYNNKGDSAGSQQAARPASPLHWPVSARLGTPTPTSAERLQHQRVATPSRLLAEHAAKQTLHQNLDECVVSTKPGAGSKSTHNPVALDSISIIQQQHQQHQQHQHQEIRPRVDEVVRPSTTPSKAGASTLRTSLISLSPLLQQQPAEQSSSPRPGTAAGSNLTADSPRVRRQLLTNFAVALPATGGPADAGMNQSSSSSKPATIRPHDGTGSGGSNRPSTPSFQPIARPATAAGAPSTVPAGMQFAIKAAYSGSNSQPPPLCPGIEVPAAAYPQPPSTAPPRAGVEGPPTATVGQPGHSAQPHAGGLASFGILAAAFVAVQPKIAGASKLTADNKPHEGSDELPVPLHASLLAKTSLNTKGDLRRFLFTPGPVDKPLCCKVVRSSGGLLKSSAQYTLLVEQEGGKTGTFLVAARKRKGGPGGTCYVLSVDQHNISRHSTSYIGKLRSNFLGTEFVFYDSGGKPGTDSSPRCELGAALYQTNVLGTKGPRKMTVLIPKLDMTGQRPLLLSPKGEHDTLLSQYKAYNLSSFVVLRNKPPRWNQSMGAYCLNFGGRVTQASVKNFQLVSVDNMERTILQFGKVADDVFTMDYSYPMTALQAFAVCLSSFASKLACE